MDSLRPSFISSYFEILSKEARASHWKAIVPYWLIVSTVIGGVTGYFIPQGFWEDAHWDVSTAVYASFMTFNGLVLALGWNAFSRMYEILFRGDFGSYLARNNLLNPYITHITFINMVQVISVIASGIGLVMVLVENIPILYDRIALSAILALMIYGLKQTIDALTAMNDLVWQAAYFELNHPKDGTVGNVAQFKGGTNSR